MNDSLPVFGVCGYSGSGKTTALEGLLPRLRRRGLRTAVIKHDVHGIDRHAKAKDSERLFAAGADVVVVGPDDSLTRCLLPEKHTLAATIDRLLDRYDLVLLEGFKRLPVRKAWLAGPDASALPSDCGRFDPVLPWDTDRAGLLEEVILRFIQDMVPNRSPFGCVLIGGESRRMGRPKHLLLSGQGANRTWLHRTVDALGPHCEQMVFAGSGAVPKDLDHLPRISDVLGMKGPTAGLLAAMRWAPRAEWLLAACDLPGLSGQAIAWLLSHREPGRWAVVPRTSQNHPVEPLLAWYDFRCRPVIESLAADGNVAPRRIAEHPKSHTPCIPPSIATAWKDADTPEEAAARETLPG